MSVIARQTFKLKDGAQAILRSPVEADAAALIALTKANIADGAGQVAVPGEFNVSVEDEQKWIAEHNLRDDQVAIVAECAGAIIGLINFKAQTRRRLAHMGSFGMAVGEKWRGRGVGEALLGALVVWARANPRIEKVCLRVLADNKPALGLYRKLGFVEEGRHPREIKLGDGRYVDDIAMYLWVKPV